MKKIVMLCLMSFALFSIFYAGLVKCQDSGDMEYDENVQSDQSGEVVYDEEGVNQDEGIMEEPAYNMPQEESPGQTPLPPFPEGEEAGFNDTENADIEQTEYGYGTVVAVDGGAKSITVSEYDWNDDTEKNIVYTADPAIIIDGAPTFQEIPPASEVEIEYMLDAAGNRVARYITVYAPWESTGEEEQ